MYIQQILISIQLIYVHNADAIVILVLCVRRTSTVDDTRLCFHEKPTCGTRTHTRSVGMVFAFWTPFSSFWRYRRSPSFSSEQIRRLFIYCVWQRTLAS